MKINSVSGVNFKAHYTNVDIGASSINGSLKIRTVDESGKTIAAERTTVFLPSDKRSEDSFERNVARKVADHQIRYNEEIKKN